MVVVGVEFVPLKETFIMIVLAHCGNVLALFLGDDCEYLVVDVVCHELLPILSRPEEVLLEVVISWNLPVFGLFVRVEVG